MTPSNSRPVGRSPRISSAPASVHSGVVARMGDAERERQVFQSEVGENPRRRDDGGFQQQLQVLHRRERVGDERRRQQSRMRHLNQQQRHPHRRARERAQEQNRQHGVVPDGVLDAKVIHAEEQRRHEAGNNPVHQIMISIYRSGVPAERRQLNECKIWRLSAESRYAGSKSKTGEPLWPARRADGFKFVRTAYQFHPRLSANSSPPNILLAILPADLLTSIIRN